MNNGINSTNQLPNHLPNQLPNQLQNNLVTGNSSNNAGPWTNGNHFFGNNGSANASSTTAVATWLQNNPVGSSSFTARHIPYSNPRSLHVMLSQVPTHQPVNPVPGIAAGNYSTAPMPHPSILYGMPSSSSASSGVTANQPNNNIALGSLFPMGPTQTTPSLNNITATVAKVYKRRAKAVATDTTSKKPRGRPKKVPAAVSSQFQVIEQSPSATVTSATTLSSAMRMPIRPAAFATMPSTATLASYGTGMLLNSTPATSGMLLNSTPATSGMPLTAASTYIPPMNCRPILTAAMPAPPNWLTNMENSVMSLDTYNKYKISENTAEYQTISDMLYPIRVEGVEQIVNPDLWDRFVKTRTDMMRSKADDLSVLSKLGLSEKEVLRCAHLSLNFRKDPLLIPYSDNMVLLYHCTRSQANIKSICSQGLDERLSSTSAGLLGKGIYFADDPNKSLQYDGTGYIFIFAVLLGDCISVDHFSNQRNFVREPEKVMQQKRNFNDQFFDSIVARPAGHNEYVIYNRYQCCPIYQIKYDRGTIAGGAHTIFQSSCLKLPPIAWMPSPQNYAMPIQDPSINWPFFAVDIFTSMGVPPPTDRDEHNDTPQNTSQTSVDDNLATLINLGFNDETKNREILAKFNNDIDQAVNHYLDNVSPADDGIVNGVGPTTVEETSCNVSSSTSEIETLINLGFCDAAKNREVLAKFNNDVGQAVNYFLDNANGEVSDNVGANSSQSTTTTTSIIADQPIVTIDLIDDDSDYPLDETSESDAVIALKPASSPDLPDDIADLVLDYCLKREPVEMEDCPICYNEISPSSWHTLDCKHKLCVDCYSKMLTSRCTMSGIQHRYVKCPFCHATFGTEVGTCPDMKMIVSTQHIPCEGCASFSTLVIEYVGQNFRRTAYLPNNDAGREVLQLLKIAFDRRLCFTVGTSNTTGQENAIVWNIHHKTATHGGVASYGYPDPEYFDRVKSELKTFGIE